MADSPFNMMGRVLTRPNLATFLTVGMLLMLYASLSGPLSRQDAWHRRLVVQSFETPQAVPDEGYVLTLTILRALLCLYMASVFLLFGPAVRNLLLVFQAATAAGLWSWWDSLSNVAYVGDIPPVFEGLFKVIAGAGVTAFAMMSWEDLDFLVKGALLASQLLDTFLPLVGESLHDWAGCTGVYMPAKSVRGQMYDAWTGCSNKDNYYAAIFIVKIVEWGTMALGGYVATKINKLLMTLSSSMFAAEMAVAALIQSANDIIIVVQDRDAAEKAQVVLLVNKMIITYVFFGIGIVVQLGLPKYLDLLTMRFTASDEDELEKIKKEMKELSEKARCYRRWIMKIRFFAYPAMKFSASLNQHYNSIDAKVKEVEEDENTIAKWQKTNRPKAENVLQEKANGPESKKKANGPESKKESEKSSGSESGKFAWVVPAKSQGA